MKWVIIVISAIALIGMAVYIIGCFMPVKHVTSVEVHFENNSPAEVWKVITTTKDYTSWRKDLKNIEVIDDQNWKETSSHGDVISYHGEVIELERHFVTKILNKDLPFGGEWVFELRPAKQGTILKITENGEVYNPIFRFVSKYIFGHDTTLKNYSKDLAIFMKKA